ncbi:response regulator [Niveibacterium sp. 24ML]|uniref:response regulator n=1 Tax=Niveibacterium sp. 24ML TaxID=2985512 RepID=UPI00226D5603|nr:response regulator [Niveibacterium sp. 24ML]MCX9155144.1 response regulator [Niveibacterium sp. 24ML]
MLKLKALIVDDSPPNRRLPAMILGQLGWETTEVADGQSALDLAKLDTYDCILLDLLLPDMRGDEVCRRLRSEPATRAAWIVAYTAESDEQVARITARTRFDAVLPKPITRKRLLDALPPDDDPKA